MSRSPGDDDRAGPFADAQLAAFVSQPGPTFADLDVAALREAIARRARSRPQGAEMDAVIDLAVASRRARLYRPVAGAVPLVVYLHGGGWTIGQLVEQLRAEGHVIGDDTLSLTTPLMRKHLNPFGRYHFDLERMRQTGRSPGELQR